MIDSVRSAVPTPEAPRFRPAQALFLAVLAGLLGCTEDPPVNLLLAPPLVDGIHVLASGGSGSTGGGFAALGGGGGSLSAFTVSDLRLGAADVTPEPATAPIFPTTGTVVTSADFLSHRDIEVPFGNIVIGGRVTTDVAGPPGTPRRIIADSGDIVVSGILQSGAVTGLDASGLPLHAMGDVELDAPNGTIYVSGVLQSTSVDGLNDGTSAGAIKLAAQQIVVVGTIDAIGASNTAGRGGNGGAITFSVPAAGGGLLFRFAAIDASGGAGTVQGGDAGNLTFNVLGGSVDVFGTLNVPGGPAAASLGSVQGGAGGSLAIVAAGPLAFNAQFLASGGTATSTSGAAAGGNAGGLSIQNASAAAPVPVQLYGTLDVSGGVASSTESGPGTTTGGQGGIVRLGDGASPLLSLVSGSSSVDSSGAPGDVGGAAGPISLNVVGTASARVTLAGTFLSLGGAGGIGAGGNGNLIQVATSSGGSIDLLTGFFQTDGGASTSSTGGNAGQVLVLGTSASSVNLDSSATLITSNGGDGGSSGGAGTAGAIQMSLTSGTISLTGTLQAQGGNSPVQVGPLGPAGPSSGGQITIQTGAAAAGAITCRAVVQVLGGSSSATFGASVAGAAGGTVTLGTLSPAGPIIQSGSIQADGGSSTGSQPGGAGGLLRIGTAGPPITISGALTVRGGSAGSSGTGGAGGRLSANTDVSNLGGALGGITISPGALIDASGGPGFHGGNAQSDGRRNSVSSPVAVLLQAEAVPGKANAGTVVNQGTIIAEGGAPSGSGGDVLFLGGGAGGAGAPQPGILQLSGSGSGLPGDFVGSP